MIRLRWTLLLLAIGLSGCSADVTRTLPMPGATAHPSCEPGSFMGSMTMNCPER